MLLKAADAALEHGTDLNDVSSPLRHHVDQHPPVGAQHQHTSQAARPAPSRWKPRRGTWASLLVTANVALEHEQVIHGQPAPHPPVLPAPAPKRKGKEVDPSGASDVPKKVTKPKGHPAWNLGKSMGPAWNSGISTGPREGFVPANKGKKTGPRENYTPWNKNGPGAPSTRKGKVLGPRWKQRQEKEAKAAAGSLGPPTGPVG